MNDTVDAYEQGNIFPACAVIRSKFQLAQQEEKVCRSSQDELGSAQQEERSLQKLFDHVGEVRKLDGGQELFEVQNHPRGALECRHKTLKAAMVRCYSVCAVSVREVSTECLGFSPNELVFGHEVSEPFVGGEENGLGNSREPSSSVMVVGKTVPETLEAANEEELLHHSSQYILTAGACAGNKVVTLRERLNHLTPDRRK
ncbi:hypothetical protein Pcinc_000612 [Petrolisthes cinctipes]|uniref:Uncharacterized protein n=1 Tax=Petrolisthes cinctipes TaxID=88211 RepID=A0AAE1L3W4_PETCI|nr:hypothetical protein Pcinc_000612 [Petrolisthes cinctipes]